MKHDYKPGVGMDIGEAAAALASLAKEKQRAVTCDFNGAMVLTVTPSTEDEPKRYYVQNCRVEYVGNSVVFWASNNRGYTCDADEAGVYTEEEARKICGDRPDRDRMLLKSAVDKLWRRHLDAQDLAQVLDAGFSSRKREG